MVVQRSHVLCGYYDFYYQFSVQYFSCEVVIRDSVFGINGVFGELLISLNLLSAVESNVCDIRRTV